MNQKLQPRADEEATLVLRVEENGFRWRDPVFELHAPLLWASTHLGPKDVEVRRQGETIDRGFVRHCTHMGTYDAFVGLLNATERGRCNLTEIRSSEFQVGDEIRILNVPVEAQDGLWMAMQKPH